MTVSRNPLSKGAVDIIGKCRLLVTAYAEGSRNLIELRTREQAGRSVNVRPYCDLSVPQAKELRRLLDLAIAAAETASRPDETIPQAAGRGPASAVQAYGEARSDR